MRLIALLLVVFLGACNNDKTDKTPATDAPTVSTPAPSATPAAKTEVLYPAYPEEKLKFLFDNSDYVDYVFYELPISMSLNEQASIQYSVSHVSLEPAPINANCKSLGRIFFQQTGENIAEAEIVFNGPENCSYFIFYENGQKKYANAMTEAGIKYLQQNLMNAIKSMQNAQQQQ